MNKILREEITLDEKILPLDLGFFKEMVLPISYSFVLTFPNREIYDLHYDRKELGKKLLKDTIIELILLNKVQVKRCKLQIKYCFGLLKFKVDRYKLELTHSIERLDSWFENLTLDSIRSINCDNAYSKSYLKGQLIKLLDNVLGKYLVFKPEQDMIENVVLHYDEDYWTIKRKSNLIIFKHLLIKPNQDKLAIAEKEYIEFNNHVNNLRNTDMNFSRFYDELQEQIEKVYSKKRDTGSSE